MIYSKKKPSKPAKARLVAEVLDREQYEALASFRYALRAFLAFSESVTRKAGVTAQQYQALLAIKASPKEVLLIGELASKLLIRHNAAVQLTDRLVLAGFICRVSSPNDRRAVELHLTPKGNKCIGFLAATHYGELMNRHSELADIIRYGKRLSLIR